MLRKITIQNYAIIDILEIEFSGRLNIITGETGAGKSIIVGALGLVLGERADSTVLVNKEKKCVVEGMFDVKGKKVIQSFLEEHELDISDELFIRREIATNGKSRAFVNDTPVTLAQLHGLSGALVDMHQQFDTQELGKDVFQRDVIDAMADNAASLAEYQLVFKKWQHTKRECQNLQEQKNAFNKEYDYNQFQYTELEEAGFRENELEEIDADLKLQNNAEGIKNVLTKAGYALQEGESPVVQQLKSLLNQLQGYVSYHPLLTQLVQRLHSAQIELQDIADEIESINQQVNYDPGKIEELNERLSLGYKLQKKHGVKTTHELLVIQQELEEKLKAVFSIDEQIQQKEKEAAQLSDKASQLAGKIAAARMKQVKPLEEAVNKLLVQVGMPNAKLKVVVQAKELDMYGGNSIEFLFDANKSGQFQPVGKVASGGELSRLMLCIKSLVAKKMDLATLIFDEIDTGISGEAAKQVGIIMKELAARRQVISITHQPQIAGKADAHFFVYKEIVKDAVKTNIRQLTTEERITAIAKMLSGEKPTAAAMENAREMVMN